MDSFSLSNSLSKGSVYESDSLFKAYRDDAASVFKELPEIFQESALIDRFHGFIRGKNIPRMTDDMKIKGWALSSEYFCSVLHEAGFHVMIYASDSWLRDEIYMEELQDLCGFWMAHYNVEHPSFPFVFSMWQYSRAGQVAGIPYPVDLDLLIRKR